MKRRIAIGMIAVLAIVAVGAYMWPSSDVTAIENVPYFPEGSPDLPVPGEPLTAKAIYPGEEFLDSFPGLPGTDRRVTDGATEHEDAPGEGNLLPVSPFPGRTEDRAIFRAPGEGNLLPEAPFHSDTKLGDDSGTMDFERSGAVSRVIRPTGLYLGGSPDLPPTGPTLVLEEEKALNRVAIPIITREDFFGSNHENDEVIDATGYVASESPALGPHDFRAITREDFLESNFGNNELQRVVADDTGPHNAPDAVDWYNGTYVHDLPELKEESKDVAVARGGITQVHRSNFNPFARPWDPAEAIIMLNFAEPERSEAIESGYDNPAPGTYRAIVDGYYIFPGSWGDEGDTAVRKAYKLVDPANGVYVDESKP